ncbi:membrane protein [Cypionkella aquatica]|uniref:Membrane protein n=1 Tax=Cypionkella aquatica TaxID=1756042 RepID=A0AA37UBP2_9RHOB|nr:DMT family transporter [Cypionkella aquatica]GLS88526.1 membrane protein [Cypionkella aquatica]
MAISDNLRGALYMNLSMFAFTVNDAIMKSLTHALPLYQTIALRGTVAVLGLLILARASGGLRLPPNRHDRILIALRSLADVAATILFLTALKHMPLATLSAVMQVTPLAVTLAAALYYKDRIGWRRMLAIFVGFLGVMLIIRPGMEGFDIWSVLGLGSVATVVVRDLSVRRLSSAVPSQVVALGAGFAVMVMGFAGSALEGWQAVTPLHILQILGAGSMVIVGYICSVSAMRVGDIGFVAPFRYTSLLWAIILGWVFFATFPDGYALIGAAIVVATGIYTLLRERKLRILARTAAGAV